ncbi:FtsX-like permease family protein [Neobacillus sp.]|uniref:FtsX-like permease family protein n=1 Tax=Neobacillus sp. TaxID=2675273 RepID=UPI0035B528EE
MFKLALKFLFSRKKWLILMIGSLAITIASVTSIFTASEAIKEALKEKAYNLYGEHTGILTGIYETKESLQKEANMVGEYQLIDTIIIDKDKLATIGWMDNDALKLGHIKLLEGKFPKKDKEVAIESAYLQLIDDNWKIGQKRKIHINDKEVNVRLVGIIKNYSAQWSVPINLEKGVNDFPNIFISNKHTYTESKSKNFLIKFNGNNKKATEKMEHLLNKFNQKGMINEKLFNKGLIDYDTIFFLSITFQCLTLLLSLFCIVSLFSYFNIEQNHKIAVLKAIGSNKLKLYKIYFYQCLIIFLLSLIVAIPLQLVLHLLIIDQSFKQGTINTSNIFYLISVIAIWLFLIFIIIFFISTRSVKKSDRFSINELLSKQMDPSYLYDIFTKKFNLKSFTKKQLARQLFIYPKQLIFTILILCFTILLITFSIFIQKEAAGIWDTTQEYYLTSQETYGYETIDNFNVLKNQGLTFSVEDVKEIEKIPGILYIDKNPFMVDVHPLIHSNLITPSIRKWIEDYGSVDDLNNDKEIIPNVKYTIVNSEEFNEIYSGKEYKDFVGKILLYIPSNNRSSNDKELVGKKLSLIKKYKSNNGFETIQKDFEIFDVINKPLVKKIIDHHKIQNNEITIVLDEQTALKSGLFPGYNELGIYIQKNLSTREYENIDHKVTGLIATIPGSLFQNIPEFIKEDTKIYSLTGFLGILSFIVASILTVISIVIIVFSKYNLEKRNWGIYLSLGMNKKQIIKFLNLEIQTYLFISTIISSIIFIIGMIIINHIYPFSFYLKYFCLAILSISIFLIIGSVVLGKIIKNQSISSILRIVE